VKQAKTMEQQILVDRIDHGAFRCDHIGKTTRRNYPWFCGQLA
jgi:hypothetical protein